MHSSVVRRQVWRSPALGALALGLVILSACAGMPEPRELYAPGGFNTVPHASRMLQVAIGMEEQGDMVAALALYQRATANPDDALFAYIRIGEIHTRTGNLKRAIAAYEAALALDPRSSEAQLGLGSALVQSGDIDSGLALLRRAAPVVGTAIAYNRLGLAQTLSGNSSTAVESLQRAVALEPSDLDFRTNLALAAALDGRHDMAIGIARDTARAPNAEMRHRRNLIIVLGLCRRGDARSAEDANLPASEVRTLLSRANAILAIKDPRARAKALGTVLG